MRPPAESTGACMGSRGRVHRRDRRAAGGTQVHRHAHADARAVGRRSPPTRSPTPASRRRRSTAWCARATSPRRRCSCPRPSPSTAAGRSTSPSGSTSAAPPRSGWCGAPPPRSSSGSARWWCARPSGNRDRRRRSPRRGSSPRIVYGASSMEWGSPQAEFDVPYGNVAQNCGYAMYAQRYHDLYGWDERARAKIAVRPARERVREPVGGVLRATDHRRRRARVARDRDAAPPARDRDAVHGRRRVRRDDRRARHAISRTGR